MGNIFTDIVDDVEVRPSSSKLVLKWVVRISVALISAAFVLGQVKTLTITKRNSMESSLNANTEAIIELRAEMKAGFEQVNARIDKGYDDGMKIFNDFQQYNKEQLKLVIDYGSTSKELLKRMLDVNTMEKTKSVETSIQQAKNEQPSAPVSVKSETPSPSIIVTPVGQRGNKGKDSNNYLSLLYFISKSTNDTTFKLTGATKEYINSIDRNKYRVGDMVQNETNPRLFDVTYVNK
jgi:hypothetical protein